jgi:hypothetical protein
VVDVEEHGPPTPRVLEPPPEPPRAVRVEQPPPAPPAPAPTIVSAQPEGQNNASHASNTYADARRMRDAARWRTTTAIPQGETGLLGAWTYAVTVYPVRAMTVHLRRIEPAAGTYEILLYGDQLLGGDFPDRCLYDEVRRQRRQPTVAERFTGRIRAMTADGSYLDVGSGELALPPEPTTAAPSWSNPQNAWASPWGAPPWASGSMGTPAPWGMPPWGFGGGGYGMAMGGPVMAMQQKIAELEAKLAVAQPPAALAGHPELVEMWRIMQQTISETHRHNNQTTLDPTVSKMMDLAFTQLAKSNTPASQVDPFAMLDKVLTLADKLGGGRSSGLQIHQVGESMLVEDKDGKLDVGTSVALSVMKDGKDALKGIATALRTRAAQSGSGAARPGAAAKPTVATPPAAAANGAAKLPA